MFSKFKNALLFYPATNRNNEQPEISRYRRELPPVHYSLKVQSFSSVKEKCEKYTSDVFEAQGLKWRLCLYPNGRKDPNSQSKKRENDYISLYLHIVETDGYPSGWQVHVNFKLFVFDKKNDNYLTIQDITEGGVRCFHEKDPELGFAQFISYKDFYNPSNGFLIYDSCVFGAELLVLHSMMNQNPSKDVFQIEYSNIFMWEVSNFSEREHWLYIESEMFEAGGMPWTLSVYPKGNDGSTYGPKRVSLCLFLHSSHDLPPEKQISVTYKMHILNKDDNSKNLERASPGTIQFSKGVSRYEENIIALKDLLDPSSGFVKNDTLSVQVQVFLL